MRGALGGLLIIVGLLAILTGIALALYPLIDLYQSNLADPLARSDSADAAVQPAMVRGLIVGAAGLLPLIAGNILVKGAILRALARRRSPKSNSP